MSGAANVRRRLVRDVVGAARRAAAGLVPVVVDLGPTAPKLESFCDSVVDDAGGLALVLRPIAVDALPAQRCSVRVSCDDGAGSFSISAARVVAHGPDAARVPLAGALLTPLRRRRSARARTAPLAAIIPACTEDLGVHSFPVLDIGADFCALEAAVGLPPGSELDLVEVFCGQRLLRRCGATVVESTAWRAPHGERVFRWRLALGPVPSRARRHELVSSEEKVRSALRYGSVLGVPARVHAPGHAPLDATFGAAEGAALQLAVGEHAITPQTLVRLSFQLFTESYEADVRVLSTQDRTMTTTWPLLLKRRHQRREQRVLVPERGLVRIRFRNPATGRRVGRDVLDVSFGGVRIATAASDVLWPDLTLEEATLHWRGRRIRIREAVVRSVETGEAHLAISRHDVGSDVGMIDLIAALRHPALVPDDGSRFEQMVELQREVHALTSYAARTLPAADGAADVWRRMHTRAPDVCRTLVRLEHGEIVATVSAVRAWEHAWFPGSMAALPDRQWRAPAGLDLAYTDHIVLRPDAHYTVMAVRVGNERQSAFLGGFLRVSGTPDVGARRTVDMWALPAGAPRPVARTGSFQVRPVPRSEEALVSRAAARTYSSIHAAALSIVPGELTLPDTARRFARAGIDRHRDAFVVGDGDRPAVAVLCEHAPPGLHVNYFFSASWLFPIHSEERDADAWAAAIAHVVAARPPTPEGDCLLLLPAGAGSESAARAGFRYQFSLDVYAYNRAGTQRWYDYVHHLRGDWVAERSLEESRGASRIRHRRAS